VSPKETSLFAALLQRRRSHEPTAYITGHKEFFGLDFIVDSSVLIPRPESELLVEHALRLASTAFADACLIADVGTGCGAIAVAVAANVPHAKIYAADLSPEALAVAGRNCERHGVGSRVTLVQGDLLGALPERVHLIVANLPYVRESELAGLSPEVSRFEPRIALAGGVDGLSKIERLLSCASEYLLDAGVVLLEIDSRQRRRVCDMAHSLIPGSEIEVATDLGGLSRVVAIQTRKGGGRGIARRG
jgi:release factor glutamine methyltransferase